MTNDRFVTDCIPSNLEGKDWEYPAGSELTSATAFSRRKLTPHVRNQGSIGSCVGQSARVVLSDTDSYRDLNLSPMWLYKSAKRHDEWAGEQYSGTSVSGVCRAMLKEGCCVESYYPYNANNEDYKALDGANNDASQRKIHAYYFLSLDRTKEIMNLLTSESLMFSMNLKECFYSVGKDGKISKAEFDADEKFIGGHAMTIIGWKHFDGALYWEVQNSWGERWGDEGHCFIQHSLLKKYSTSGAYYIVTNKEAAENLQYKVPVKLTLASRVVGIVKYIPVTIYQFFEDNFRKLKKWVKKKF